MVTQSRMNNAKLLSLLALLPNYPKLGAAYLYCTCAQKGNVANGQAVHPIFLEFTKNRARAAYLINRTYLSLTYALCILTECRNEPVRSSIICLL